MTVTCPFCLSISRSDSSSESDADKASKTGSPAGSGTPEPPQMSPLGGSPLEEEEEEGGDPQQPRKGGGGGSERQTVEGIFGDAADLSSSCVSFFGREGRKLSACSRMRPLLNVNKQAK